MNYRESGLPILIWTFVLFFGVACVMMAVSEKSYHEEVIRTMPRAKV